MRAEIIIEWIMPFNKRATFILDIINSMFDSYFHILYIEYIFIRARATFVDSAEVFNVLYSMRPT